MLSFSHNFEEPQIFINTTFIIAYLYLKVDYLRENILKIFYIIKQIYS